MLRNDRGFTLIEMIAAMIIISIFTAAAVIKYDAFKKGAKESAINLSVSELNTREKLCWENARLSMGYEDDDTLQLSMIAEDLYDLGRSTSWRSGPGSTGGTLMTNAGSAVLTRTPSTRASPGHWVR